MTVETLARFTLGVLDKQAEFFRSRDQRTLVQSKAMEKKLRQECEAVLRRAEMDAIEAKVRQGASNAKPPD
jgi:hypothetical protein